MKKYLFLIIIFLTPLLNSCSYFNLLTYSQWKDQNSSNLEPDVYVGGNYYIGSLKPCYWKNWERVDLPLPSGYTSGSVYSIFVDGNDIYCGGTLDTYACCWKNNKILFIDNLNNSTIYAITVSGGILYSAGSAPSTALFWINDKRHYLGSLGLAQSIFIDNETNDIYIGGQMNNYPCYWKNKTPFIQYTGALSNNINSITVISGKIHFTTSESNLNNLYINGNFYSYSGTLYTVFPYNNDIYASGINSGELVYWKNGAENLITPAGDNTKIFIYDNTLFVSGTTTGGYAFVWSNNIFYNLPYSGTASAALSIFVKGRN